MPGTSDTQGVNTDTAVPLALEAAERVGGVKVAFHLERQHAYGGCFCADFMNVETSLSWKEHRDHS